MTNERTPPSPLSGSVSYNDQPQIRRLLGSRVDNEVGSIDSADDLPELPRPRLARMTEALWEIRRQRRVEDDRRSIMPLVVNVGLMLQTSETPPERVRRAMEQIFGFVMAGVPVYEQFANNSSDGGFFLLRISEPFSCEMECRRRRESAGVVEHFSLVAYDENEYQLYYLDHVVEQGKYHSLREFLLNFRTAGSLSQALSVMLLEQATSRDAHSPSLRSGSSATLEAVAAAVQRLSDTTDSDEPLPRPYRPERPAPSRQPRNIRIRSNE